MRIASKEKYFKNTLFFIFGDNGTPGKIPHMPKAEEALRLGTYHNPVLSFIYFISLSLLISAMTFGLIALVECKISG